MFALAKKPKASLESSTNDPKKSKERLHRGFLGYLAREPSVDHDGAFL